MEEKTLELEPIHGMDRFRVYIAMNKTIYNKEGQIITLTEIGRTAFHRVCGFLDEGYYNIDLMEKK